MEIILKPVITEKMTAISEKYNRYGFLVNRNANKLQIKEAVEQQYGVSVSAVNTMIHGGKARQRYTKTGIQRGRTNSFKKAIVTLMEGDTIDFYSSI
ncbi:MAG: 50S ribosomal protein L23 [Salibacteraceae bacterium]